MSALISGIHRWASMQRASHRFHRLSGRTCQTLFADDTPETCIYSNWSPWSACSSSTCEKGKRMRQRMLKAQLDLSVPCPDTQDFQPCMGPGCSDEGKETDTPGQLERTGEGRLPDNMAPLHPFRVASLSMMSSQNGCLLQYLEASEHTAHHLITEF